MLDDPRKGTAVAALGGGGAMVLVTYILFLLHVDVPAPVVAAITGAVGAIAGRWAHSGNIREDRAAIHKLILAWLGEQAAPKPPGTVAQNVLPTSHVLAPMPPVSPPRPSPMGDVRP